MPIRQQHFSARPNGNATAAPHETDALTGQGSSVTASGIAPGPAGSKRLGLVVLLYFSCSGVNFQLPCIQLYTTCLWLK